MAEALVTIFLQRLSDLITEEANLLHGVDEEVKLLQNELQWISLSLKCADVKRRYDPKVKLWVNQLREVTFHAEDVIDEYISKIHPRGNNICGFVLSLKTFISCTRQLPLLHELGNQIKAINTMAEKISANKSKYGIEDGQDIVHGESSMQQKIKRAPVNEKLPDVVGIEDSAKKVKSLLMGGGDDGQRRVVVSIFGMGGLGKTTLAMKVYNSSDVKRHFDCFAWISVSQEYRMTELLQGIIKCFMTCSKEELEKVEEEELRMKLREYLQGDHKKYLIVLDDIWDTQVWDHLNTGFPDANNGSRILLTTRNRHVAAHADYSSSNNIHELRFLNKVESWELFLNKIFPLGGRGSSSTDQEYSRCPLELEELGKEIVEKCHGLPLAIVVLGGLLLSKEKTLIAWSKVNDSVNWQLAQHGDGSSHSCFAILALSYNDLPYYLKPCFMYMGLFPEDREIRASKLFQYWIAEGFVQRRGEQTMEEIAEDYLEELIHRSMIQVRTWRHDGRVRTCLIHDLLRELSIAESKEEKFFQVFQSDGGEYSEPNSFRRLTIHDGKANKCFNIDKYSSNFRYTSCIRSLICFEGWVLKGKQFFTSLSGRFKLLRVLELSIYHMSTSTLLDEIGELVHLKYLCVRMNNCYPYIKIPHSIGKLVNLETLNLGWCVSSESINQISRLSQLRHLYLSVSKSTRGNCWKVRSTCPLGNLFNLQTLVIDSFDWINGDTLSKLKKLKKLVILDYYHMPPNDKFFDFIGELTSLRSLKLKINKGFLASLRFSQHNYLTKLDFSGRLSSEFLFPPSLVKLSLEISEINTEQMEVIGKLPNLKFLALSVDYVEKEMLFLEGSFLRLQSLKLREIEELEELIMEEGTLKNLTHLEICGCHRLKMIPDGLQQLTTLQVVGMPDVFEARLAKNVGEDWDKIKHIPWVVITHNEDFLGFSKTNWWRSIV